ncbi:hypothetical protein [Escherichia coli]|uniref:hypothetical protein n=1 Tax=Escherichia coli TaxID=562 RepID=UPI003CC90E96
MTDGNYLYQVRVIDAVGNVGATDSQNVVIDTIAPDPAVKPSPSARSLPIRA